MHAVLTSHATSRPCESRAYCSSACRRDAIASMSRTIRLHWTATRMPTHTTAQPMAISCRVLPMLCTLASRSAHRSFTGAIKNIESTRGAARPTIDGGGGCDSGGCESLRPRWRELLPLRDVPTLPSNGSDVVGVRSSGMAPGRCRLRLGKDGLHASGGAEVAGDTVILPNLAGRGPER